MVVGNGDEVAVRVAVDVAVRVGVGVEVDVGRAVGELVAVPDTVVTKRKSSMSMAPATGNHIRRPNDDDGAEAMNPTKSVTGT